MRIGEPNSPPAIDDEVSRLIVMAGHRAIRTSAPSLDPSGFEVDDASSAFLRAKHFPFAAQAIPFVRPVYLRKFSTRP